MKILDENNNEIDVFTQEELKAIEDAKNTELSQIQEQLKIKEDELQKLKDKDLNFTNLREKAKTAEKEVEALKKDIDEKIGLVKKEVLEGVMQDYYQESLSSLSSEDDELKKKIEYHYKRLQDPASTKQEVDKKLRDAWVLATRQDMPNALNMGVISSGGVSRPQIKQSSPFSAEEKALAQKLAQSGGLKLDESDFK